MFNGGGMSFLFSQFTNQGPVFLVYLVAIVLAFNYMGRARLPSILVLIGVAISILTTIFVITAQTYIMNHREATDGIARQMMLVALLSSIARAAGMGFFIAAVFVDRNHVASADRYLHE